MIPRSPLGHPPHVARFTSFIQEEEVARGQLEETALDLDALGMDSTAVRRRLQGSRPVMGSLRLMRIQVIAEQWWTKPVGRSH